MFPVGDLMRLNTYYASNEFQAVAVVNLCSRRIRGHGVLMVGDGKDAAADEAVRRHGEVATRIAAEVRHAATLDQTRLTKVTSLLHAFRPPGAPTRFNAAKRALEGHGIRLDSGWGDVQRPGVLTLSLRDKFENLAALHGTDETIRMSSWGPAQVDTAERHLPPYEEPKSDEVLWFDVDPPLPPSRSGSNLPRENVERHTVIHRDPDASSRKHEVPKASSDSSALNQRAEHLWTQLKDWCHGLSEQMVSDLLDPDVQPKVETYGDEKDGVRGVSVVAVVAREVSSTGQGYQRVSEELVFQLVEIVVGEGWMITCWHPSRIYAGTTLDRPGPPLLREPFLNHVRHRWLDNASRSETSGDLGIYLVRALVDTYDASHRMMERWVESWEVEFYKSLTSSDKPKQLKEAAGEISNFLSMVAEFRRRLTAFEHGRWSTADKSWFPGLSDHQNGGDDGISEQVEALAASVQAADKKLTALSTDIRADMDLLMLQSAATQQESTERIQGYLAKVTGLVLVPTLVAGLFGANTQLPGGGSWMGFEIMLVLMVLSAIGVYLVIRKLSR